MREKKLLSQKKQTVHDSVLLIMCVVELCGDRQYSVIDTGHGLQVALLLLPLGVQIPQPV